MLYKFLKKVGVLYLVTVIAILQMGCLPESSKEIEKARARDNKERGLRKKHEDTLDVFRKSFQQTTSKIEDIRNDSKINNISKDIRLSRVYRKFLQQEYITYLKAMYEYLGYIAKYETDISKQKECKIFYQQVYSHLLYVEKLLHGDNLNLEKSYQLIMKDIKIFKVIYSSSENLFSFVQEI